jgi:hypothetical protein
VRTYYELEDWHWDMINDRGMVKGKKVWFADIDDSDKMVNEGIITGHDVHIEGDVELKIKVVKEYDYSVPDNIWVEDETKRKSVERYEYTKTVFMDNCFDTREEAVERGIFLLVTRIKVLESRVEYEEIKLNELRKEKNNG